MPAPASPVAVVVGLCPHGLAIARSLNYSGIKVIALEANRRLAGTKTKCADIVFVDDINGPGLIEALASLAPSVSGSATPILFLTNDRMIATVGENYERIRNIYLLSWGPSRDAILPLLRKESIELRCLETGIPHPKSRMIRSRSDSVPPQFDLSFPIIFKPDQPVSAYKTLVVETIEEVEDWWPTIESCLPAIAQEFIPGDDSTIRFAALYLDRGEVVARFEGRKLRSRPMGHTSIAIGETNDSLHSLAKRFFGGLDISGPVSLEVKSGPDGKQWVIEPTVGRTDFWVGLCIHDKVDLPLIEYETITGGSSPHTAQQNRLCG